MERNFPFRTEDSLSLSNPMEPNGTGLGSYYHHAPPPPQQAAAPAQTHQSPAATSAPPPPTNGTQTNSGERGSLPVDPLSVAPGGGVRKKRGRPRKYAHAEGGGSRPGPFHSASALPLPSSSSSSKKKDQLHALGNVGQSFTPHIIEVSDGEDVGQKIMSFRQQCKRELCIVSASGSISNASLRQPATSGGNITVEGRFEILSLSGSYVRTEFGGITGGLSVCLSSSTDGQIFGGGVGGPLKAAGPVEVIVGTFTINAKKDADFGIKADVGGASVSNAGFQARTDDHQSIGRNQFTIHSQGMQMTHSQPPSWRNDLDANYELAGTGYGPQESPENGNYGQIRD